MPARDGYIVGESGPEVFVPAEPGKVIHLCHFCATEPRAIYRGIPFVGAFRSEMPERLHAADVWRDKHVGGSRLGSPRTDETFRRYLEESPFLTETAEYEGHKDLTDHYAFPLRAALAELAGRGRETDPYPFMARALFLTALRDGDWDAALGSLGINPPAIRWVYLERALYLLWKRYDIEPRARAA